jgi:Na+-translocating ferredoxin:NAD+ oxidoreductase RnfC subunit
MTGSLVGLLEAAGLTGRGGAGFSTALEARAAATEGASLIVNACDGEYGAVKDTYVVDHHLSELVRGTELLSGNGIRYAARRGSRAEARLRSAGVDVLSVPHRYVSSEESALVSLANGGLARPMTKRAPVVFGSVSPDGRRLPPTVVLNAETVWRVRRSRTGVWSGSARSAPQRNPVRGSLPCLVTLGRRVSSRPPPGRSWTSFSTLRAEATGRWPAWASAA